MTAQPPSWIVVGGGVLGLALARHLGLAGRKVRVLEAASHPGGVADAWTLEPSEGPAVRWDRHYHVILPGDFRLRLLLAELGHEHRIRWRRPRTGLVRRGRLVSISSNFDIVRNLRLGPVALARLGATILGTSWIRDGRRFDRQSSAQWLRRASGDKVYRAIWRPLLEAKLGPLAERASAVFIWTVLRRLAAARRSGLDRDRFGTLPEGCETLVTALVDSLEQQGVTIECGARVEGLKPIANGAAGHPAGWRVSGTDRSWTADRVVLATPAPVASRLSPGLSPDEIEVLEEGETLGLVCASLLLDKPLSPYYLTYLTDPAPFTAVVESSHLAGLEVTGGHSLVYLPRYLAPDDPLFERSDEDIRELFLPALGRFFPSLAERRILTWKVSRVRHLLPVPLPGQWGRTPPVDTSRPGLHLATPAHLRDGTLNLEATLGLADEIGRHLAGLPGLGSQPRLEPGDGV